MSYVAFKVTVKLSGLVFQALSLSSQTLVKFTFFLFATSYAFVNETVAIVYVTYLYAYDGYLRELFVRDGTEAKASDGRKILATKDFEAKETSDGIFHLYCENEDGKKTDTFVSVKSTAR